MHSKHYVCIGNHGNVLLTACRWVLAARSGACMAALMFAWNRVPVETVMKSWNSIVMESGNPGMNFFNCSETKHLLSFRPNISVSLAPARVFHNQLHMVGHH